MTPAPRDGSYLLVMDRNFDPRVSSHTGESFKIVLCNIRMTFFEHWSKLHAEYVQKKLCLEQEIQSLLKETQFEEMKLDNEVQMAEIRREMERNGSETSLNEIQVWRQEHSQPEHSRGNEHHHRVREIDSDSIPWPPQIITNEQKSNNYENLKWNRFTYCQT